jgi:hypothetical protein
MMDASLARSLATNLSGGGRASSSACYRLARTMRRRVILAVICCLAASASAINGYAQTAVPRATASATYHAERVASGPELPEPAVSDNGKWVIDEQAKPGSRAALYLWQRGTGKFRALHVRGNGGPYPSFHISDDGRRYTYDCASNVICLRRVDGPVETRFSCKNSKDSVWVLASSDLNTLLLTCSYLRSGTTRLVRRGRTVRSFSGIAEALSSAGDSFVIGHGGGLTVHQGSHSEPLDGVPLAISRNGRYVWLQGNPTMIRDLQTRTTRRLPPTIQPPAGGSGIVTAGITNTGRAIVSILGTNDSIECKEECPTTVQRIDTVTGARDVVATTTTAYDYLDISGDGRTVVARSLVSPPKNGSNPDGFALDILTALP